MSCLSKVGKPVTESQRAIKSKALPLVGLCSAGSPHRPVAALSTLQMKKSNAIILSLLLAACVTQPHRAYLPSPGDVIEGVKVGDRVDVFLHDYTRHRFLVTRIDEIGLHGSQTRFAYSDMKAVVVLGKYPPRYLPSLNFSY